ncbi:hypothetical protein Clacol_009157 [Clathrus columnatus]|uniref:Peptide-O-fucosyltransferase n=1 Tax=Clathrus columnatus TaxID=1419009 RepID=A0AAV5APB4_9AGAM|nr:hypothetical protein Clacol_009157 [Clathrus columnatus]
MQAQEILLFHHLALETSRKYVYQPLVWRPRGEKAIVPLSAFLPSVTHDSLSSIVFEQVCPEEEVLHVRLRAATWSEQWEYAVSKLKEDTKCMVVDDWIMSWNYLASPGIWPIWSKFETYLKNYYYWSPSILSITERIQNKLELQSETPGKGQPYLAIHLRRGEFMFKKDSPSTTLSAKSVLSGDFEEHCEHLAFKKIGFTTWATLPILQPSVFPPSIVPSNMSSVIEHCYPSITRILSAITLQAKRHPEARKLLILHDGTLDHPLVYVDLYRIRAALTSEVWTQQQGWQNGPMKQISTTEGFIGWGEHDWMVCVDVELARRSTAFIGNGFSSLSTQVSALRMADGSSEEDITFV